MWPACSTRTFCALMVIPRSRSMSMESRYCSRMRRGSTAPVISRMRSERVDLPWSTWLMIEKLRMRSTATGPRSVAEGGTVRRSYRPRPAAPTPGQGTWCRTPPSRAGRKRPATCYSCAPHRWVPVPPRPPSRTPRNRHVANIKSQIKRNRQNEKRRLRNKSVRAEMRTRSKTAVVAAENGFEDSRRAAAPGRQAHRQGRRPGRDPQEHGREPQVAARPAHRRPRGFRRVGPVPPGAGPGSTPPGGSLPQVEGEHLLRHDPRPRASASSSHSSNEGPCLGRYSSSMA